MTVNRRKFLAGAAAVAASLRPVASTASPFPPTAGGGRFVASDGSSRFPLVHP